LGQVQIRYYGYNGFVVEGNGHKVVIDPEDLYLLRMRPVRPRGLSGTMPLTLW